MTGVEAPWEAAIGAHRRGEGGGRRRGGRGARLGGRAAGGAPWGWPLGAPGCPMRALCTWLAAMREEGRRRKEKREKKRKRRKRKRRKRKGKKYGKFSKLENF
jgi:hypothetical protein